MKVAMSFIMAGLLSAGIAACSSDHDFVEEAAPETFGHPMLGDEQMPNPLRQMCATMSNFPKATSMSMDVNSISWARRWS